MAVFDHERGVRAMIFGWGHDDGCVANACARQLFDRREDGNIRADFSRYASGAFFIQIRERCELAGIRCARELGCMQRVNLAHPAQAGHSNL